MYFSLDTYYINLFSKYEHSLLNYPITIYWNLSPITEHILVVWRIDCRTIVSDVSISNHSQMWVGRKAFRLT